MKEESGREKEPTQRSETRTRGEDGKNLHSFAKRSDGAFESQRESSRFPSVVLSWISVTSQPHEL